MTSAFPSQRLKIRFLPAVPGTNAQGAAVAAAFSAQAAKEAADVAVDATASKVNKAGDVMTGPLVLSGAPTDPSHAATKQYVDNADTANTTLANTKLPIAGGTMTGFITLNADPTALLHAATKQYTDTADALKVAKAGDTMTGALILPSASPTNPLQAVHKQYVDGAGTGVFQPLDNDLTSIAAQTATGTWFFRQGDGSWAPVIVGSNLTLNTTTGRLDATGGAGGGGGDVSSLGDTFTTSSLAAYADATGDAIRAMNLGPGLQIGGAAPPVAGTMSLTAPLAAYAALTPAANQLPYYDSGTTAALTPLTSFARGLLDDGDAPTMRTTIGAIGNPMSADLTIAKAGPQLILNKNATSPGAGILGQNAGVTRWLMSLGNATTEVGTNQGSDFTISRYTDAGALIDTPMLIQRTNGGVTFTGAAVHGGDITIAKVQPLLILDKNAAGQADGIQAKSAGLMRWQMNLGNATAEGGGNAGSDFELSRWADAGTQIDVALGIVRSTGVATFSASPNAPTPGAADNSTKMATTAFVAGAIAAATGFTTGDVKLTLKTVADAGWIMMDDTGIGSASSGAAKSGAQYQALFLLLFNNIIDFWCPILTSTGAATTRAAQGTAAAAWAANCRMTLPRVLGRALAVGGNGAGLSSRAHGGYMGEETHVQTVAEMASHGHGISDPTHLHGPIGSSYFMVGGGGITDFGLAGGFAMYATNTIAGSTAYGPTNIVVANNGSSAGANVIQPTSFMNVMVKL